MNRIALSAILLCSASLSVLAQSSAPVVSSAAKMLRQNYVGKDLGEDMAKAIEAAQASGAYDSLTTPADLASRLTQDMQKISHDQHVRIAPPGGRGAGRGGQGGGGGINGGRGGVFANVELTPDKIGVFTLRGFSQVSDTTKAEVDAAFNKVEGARALIFDLRPSGGGTPDMVEYVISYLYGAGSHVEINDLFAARINEHHENWTWPELPAHRYPDAPVYILTAARTVSGAEGFAYDLQALKRGKVIGEKTRGAANASYVFPLENGFTITVPVAYVINPVTKTSWENVGVIPDIDVPAEQAMDKALSDLKTAELAKH